MIVNNFAVHRGDRSGIYIPIIINVEYIPGTSNTEYTADVKP